MEQPAPTDVRIRIDDDDRQQQQRTADSPDDRGTDDDEDDTGRRPWDEDVLVELRNIHKTYLLGIEGVPALRCVSHGVGMFLITF